MYTIHEVLPLLRMRENASLDPLEKRVLQDCLEAICAEPSDLEQARKEIFARGSEISILLRWGILPGESEPIRQVYAEIEEILISTEAGAPLAIVNILMRLSEQARLSLELAPPEEERAWGEICDALPINAAEATRWGGAFRGGVLPGNGDTGGWAVLSC